MAKRARNTGTVVGVLGGSYVTTEADAARNRAALPPDHPLYQAPPPRCADGDPDLPRPAESEDGP